MLDDVQLLSGPTLYLPSGEVCLFILLGTLLHPSQLAPVLLAIGGAAVVGQQITMKFKEMVEKVRTKLSVDSGLATPRSDTGRVRRGGAQRPESIKARSRPLM